MNHEYLMFAALMAQLLLFGLYVWLIFSKTHEPAWTFGFLIIGVVFTLAVIIAVGKVEQNTSHGLDIILGSITTLVGGWSGFKFAKDYYDKKPPDGEQH